ARTVSSDEKPAPDTLTDQYWASVTEVAPVLAGEPDAIATAPVVPAPQGLTGTATIRALAASLPAESVAKRPSSWFCENGNGPPLQPDVTICVVPLGPA